LRKHFQVSVGVTTCGNYHTIYPLYHWNGKIAEKAVNRSVFLTM